MTFEKYRKKQDFEEIKVFKSNRPTGTIFRKSHLKINTSMFIAFDLGKDPLQMAVTIH